VQDPVDHGVGILILAKPGDALREGDGVLELLYRDRGRLDAAVALASRAVGVGDERPSPPPLILGEIGEVH
jgi:pyrimidine-nucleoside phosphorylase/thymidine phosphorylase